MRGGVYRIGVVVALLLVGSAGQVLAQGEAEAWTPRFERAHDVEPHLPQSSVYEILEDRRGFLWFATREGLGRWDGYTMRTWRVEPFNEASLPGNVIHRMMMDGAGSIWVETQANDLIPTGVARLAAPDHEQVQRYGFPDGRLFLGPDSAAWLADRDSLYRHDAATDRFVAVRARLTDYLPAVALTRRDGSVWLPTYGPVVEAYDLPTGVVRLIRTDRAGVNADTGTNTSLGRLFEDRRGTMWLTGQALSRLAPDGTLFETVLQSPPLETQDLGLGASEIIEDDTGWFWMATLDGVYRFRPERPDALQRFSLLLPGDIATQNYVTALLRDRTGAFWAGTVWGLHRADPYANPFRLIAHDPADPTSLGSGLVLSLLEDDAGALWVGTLGGGLNRLDLATGRARRYAWDTPGGTSGSWIWHLAARSDGTLFVCTGRGLDRLDTRQPDRLEPVPVTSLSRRPERIYTAYIDPTDEALWIGQRGGLVRILPSGRMETVFVTSDSVAVEYILADREAVWIATLRGLMRLDRGTRQSVTYRHDPANVTSLSHDAVLFLHRDRRQRLWVGTNSGLNRYVPETDGFVHYTAADGLPSDVVYAILEDEAGDLWLSTNRGLARLRETEAGVAFDVFSEDDGVGNVEFNRRAAARGRDGTFYFGGDRGVTAFHPDDVRRNPHLPPVVLTALHRATQDTTTTVRFVGDGPVQIAPDVSAFTFEYTALAFTNPHRNHYAVQMQGWDDAWVPMADQRRATYTNLPPGRYTFRVKAANEDGVWNEAGIAVPVVVAPWFWQTAWFQALVVVALVGLVTFVVWSFSHRAYQRRLAHLEAQQALERERARISRDMHDEVGASLTEIAILSELAQLQVARPHLGEAGGNGAGGDGAAGLPSSETATRLHQIAETSRATLDAIGQIVWALNPRNDRLDHLVAYLRESTAQTLEPTGLDVALRFPEALPTRSVTTEFRRNVFLVLREAVHNLVKHAEAARVTVTVRLDDEALELTVEDDGCGFAARRRFGNGLRNMEERAGEIGGTLTVESEPGAGTRVRLHAPLPVGEEVWERRRGRA